MATHSSRTDSVGVPLPSVVPFDLPYASRLSWELGSRVVEDEDATLCSRWRHTGRSWGLSIFEVTSETVVIRVRTPIGRERFYGAAQQDLRSAGGKLDAAPEWRRADTDERE